jgi:hypothetical protein
VKSPLDTHAAVEADLPQGWGFSVHRFDGGAEMLAAAPKKASPGLGGRVHLTRQPGGSLHLYSYGSVGQVMRAQVAVLAEARRRDWYVECSVCATPLAESERTAGYCRDCAQEAAELEEVAT